MRAPACSLFAVLLAAGACARAQAAPVRLRPAGHTTPAAGKRLVVTGPHAPARFTWRARLLPGQRIVRVDSRTLAVLGPVLPVAADDSRPHGPPVDVGPAARALARGTAVGRALGAIVNAHAVAAIRARAARDASGRRVPAVVRVRGRRVTLRLRGHRPRGRYPVVAGLTTPAAPSRRMLGTAIRYKTLPGGSLGGFYEADGVTLRPDAFAYSLEITRRFGSVTPENELKFARVEPLGPDPETDRWGPADALIGWARANNLRVRGHALVYGTRDNTPYWLYSVTQPLRLEGASLRSRAGCGDPAPCVRHFAREFLKRAVKRYRGKVDRWDVVNEPFDHACDLRGPDLDFLSYWWGGCEDSHLVEALKLTRRLDPGTPRIINAAFADTGASRTADRYYEWAKTMRETHPGLVTGFGFQMHSASPLGGRPGTPPAVSQADLVRNWSRFRRLGYQVEVTEMDVSVPRQPALDLPASLTGSAVRTGPPSAQPAAGDAQRQLNLYKRAAAACHRARCARFTVWGADDDHTFLDGLAGFYEPYRFPTLAWPYERSPDDPAAAPTGGHRAKPAYYAVLRRLRR